MDSIGTKVIPFTKRQHYIPQFYLKNFSQDNDHLHIYDKSIGDKGSFRYESTLNIAHQNHFYTFEYKNKEKGNLESLFKTFEDDAHHAIQKARLKRELDVSDKEKIATFVAFQEARTPSFKNKTESMHTVLGAKMTQMKMRVLTNESIKEIVRRKTNREISDNEVEKMRDMALDHKTVISYKYPNGWWLESMVESANASIPAFMCMDWFLFYTKQPYAFLTNDKPLMIVPPKNYNRWDGLGLLTQGVRRVIPLSSDLCLVMGEMEKDPIIEFREADDKFRKEVNEHLVKRCDRFCFSPDKGKLEKLVKELKPYSIPKRKEFSIS